MPFQVIGLWIRGLFSLILISGGIVLLVLWYQNRETIVAETIEGPGEKLNDADGQERIAVVQQTSVNWHFGFNRATGYLVSGLSLLFWSFGGGAAVYPRLFRKRGTDEPQRDISSQDHFVTLADGSRVCVNVVGPPESEPLILTHGWGLNSQEWFYARTKLSRKYRVYSWDLPGLGKSDRPRDLDWNLDKLARTLDAVVNLATGKPVVLVGHSIGAMITLTYCKLFPQALGRTVRGLVLVHGTYTNPVKTTAHARLYSALQKPVLEPLCHLMVWLSPVFSVLNVLSFVNGTAHRSTEKDSFTGHETRGQLDSLTWSYCKASPGVVGRGMLAMMRYDATNVLATIPIPTLVVAGDQDRTCLLEASRLIAQRIPDARLVVLGQSKHCGFYQNHERFHEALTNFLASIQTAEHDSKKAMIH